MLKPRQVLETYYLDARRDLLEVAALLDRYDAAVQREGHTAEDEAKLTVLRQAMARLADPDLPAGNLTRELLELFARI